MKRIPYSKLIYKHLLRYTPKLALYREDVLQEIEYALLIAPIGCEFKVASKQVSELMKQLGYSKRLGKNAGLKQNPEYYTISDQVQDVIEYYKTHTFKETCMKFQIKETRRVQYLLHKIHKKK